MKEFHILCGVAAGMVIGTLLYKHNTEARKVVNKCEATVAEKVEKVAEGAEKTIKNVTEQLKPSKSAK